MLIANQDLRIDAVVSRHLLPEPKRLAAVRALLMTFTALFTLVALVSAVGRDWPFAVLYAVLAGWTAACIRRFLPKTGTTGGGQRERPSPT